MRRHGLHVSPLPRAALAAACLLAISGCLSQFPEGGDDFTDSGPERDGAFVEGPERDGGRPDVGPPDAGASDLGPADAEPADLGADLGPVDGGCQPLSEICDGEDNDCDGVIDEDLGLGLGCDVGIGICARRGVLTCDQDGGLTCDVLPGPPAVEACNGLDDDCDGGTDEGFGVGEACVAGVDQCRVQGVYQCGPEGLLCDANPRPPSDEICNGEDDDCDGEIDEANVCGPYIAEHCQLWLGASEPDATPQNPSLTFGACPARPELEADELRCVSTGGDALFHQLIPSGDLVEESSLGAAWLCADPERPALAAWLQRSCLVYLGQAINRQGPDFAGEWGPCPGAVSGDNGLLRCTSTGGDGQFRPLVLTAELKRNDQLAVAFICDDPEAPALSAAATAAVDITLGWYQYGGEPDRDNEVDERQPWGDGVPQWGACDSEISRDDEDVVRCVSTHGDGFFRAFRLSSDADERVSFGVAVQPRPAPADPPEE